MPDSIKVVDASAVAAFIFAEPEAETIRRRIADARLIAPMLIELELANVFLTKLRRNPERRAELRRAFEARIVLKVEHVGVDPTAALDLAESTRLSIYDASYLWLARELGAELVTLDRRLAAAAR